MRVRVQLFARLRDLAGTGETDCEVAPGATVGDVWHALARRHSAIAPLRPSVSCAINAEFARMTSAVRDGDEVAFLPPVSGGARVEA
jgi:molybdopterin converting factor subunit 1